MASGNPGERRPRPSRAGRSMADHAVARYTSRLRPHRTAPDSDTAPHADVTFVPLPIPPRDGAPARVGARASTSRQAGRTVAGRERDSLTPLEALTVAAQLALRVPLVVIGVRPDDPRAPRAEAGDPAEDASGSADSSTERTDRLFGRDTPLTHALREAVRESGAPVLIEDTRSHPLVRATPVLRGLRVLAVPRCAAPGCRGSGDRRAVRLGRRAALVERG